ncbi:MAG: HypC/HybG/HupF family hydrogenase formation chaperone [Xenococcaceae cyanobacterium MO_188.B32]|nr:HypC/HybG/HupF family hydrogenase formation chaperone [Xenococcaceae cyanobacterium MO_188.B32]
MCLAVPGEIIAILDGEPNSLWRMGRVSFGGIIKEVSLAYVPEAQIGDYVIVHVGFALSIISPDEAEKTLNYLGFAEQL